MPVEATPITTAAHEGTRALMDAIAGSYNAGVFNDKNSNGDAAEISSSYETALTESDTWIYAQFAMSQVALPAMGTPLRNRLPYPASKLAIVFAYDGRGRSDSDEKSPDGIYTRMKKEAMDEIDQIISAILYAEPTTGPTGPACDPVTLFPSCRATCWGAWPGGW